MKKILAILLLGLFHVSSAHAVLTVDITGVAGSGVTTWTFSGSATAGNGGFFEDDTFLDINDAWQNIGEYTSINDLENTNVSGNATLTIGGTTRNIDLAYIDTDSGGNDDDFGVGVTGPGDFNFSAGDVVSWTGVLTVTGIDLNDLDNSGLPSTFSTSNYGGVANTLDLTVNIGQPASVPTPATIWLLGLGLIGLLGMRSGASKTSAA